MDIDGPFNKGDTSAIWNIENAELTPIDRKKYWEDTHYNKNYKTVWSMTEDIGVRDKILYQLSLQKPLSKILIPGCGSKVLLQNDIGAKYPKTSIVCSDYEKVIEVAKHQDNVKNIEYMALDSANIGMQDEFDVVVIVNSILSDSHKENIAILNSCFQSLKPGGKLIGFFPTVFAIIDIASIENNHDRMKLVTLEKSSFYEEKQKIRQVFYTPLRLRHILKEVGFIRDVVEVFFCDSEYFTRHSNKYYGIKNSDTPIYEHFVVVHKPNT